MNFKGYYGALVKESPDVVYTSKSKLTWESKRPVTFGTVHGIKGLSPFFLHSLLPHTLTHYDMVYDVARELQVSYWLKFDRRDEPDKVELEEFVDGVLRFNKEWRVSPRDLPRLVLEIINSKDLLSKIKKSTLTVYMDRLTNDMPAGNTEIEQDLSNFTRTKLYRNTGRVWIDHKVISFWLTEDQLTPQILDDTFNQLGIKSKEKYVIDVVNIKELDKEETKGKKLPSYEEYRTRKSAPQKITAQERKRAAELMAKQHGVAGAQKAKWGQDIPLVGANRVAKYMPIDVRQKAMTSESKL